MNDADCTLTNNAEEQGRRPNPRPLSYICEKKPEVTTSEPVTEIPDTTEKTEVTDKTLEPETTEEPDITPSLEPETEANNFLPCEHNAAILPWNNIQGPVKQY